MTGKIGQGGDSGVGQKDPEDMILETNYGWVRKPAWRNSLTPPHPTAVLMEPTVAAERGQVGARDSEGPVAGLDSEENGKEQAKRVLSGDASIRQGPG